MTRATARGLAVGLMVACSGTTPGTDPTDTPTGDTGPVRVELVNGDGTACLYGVGGAGDPYGEPGETEFVAGGETEVQVILEDCASGCARDIEATCTASISGTTIVVQASGSYGLPAGTPSCPSMCVVVSATCAGPMLGVGTFDLVYADRATFGVPGTGPAPCAE